MNTILLVEDDMACRTVIADMFEFDDIGADLVCATTAEEALELARHFKPVLILMDIRLPGTDGLEATRMLKDDPRTADIPVWAITAYVLTEDHEKALAAGCDDYITKPFDSIALKGRLQEFVAEHAAVSAEEPAEGAPGEAQPGLSIREGGCKQGPRPGRLRRRCR
ncbi:MAG TPA: response regulator [Phycisphaerae bacterium]|nr:response regulator [Phycisphaerae bacterium]